MENKRGSSNPVFAKIERDIVDVQGYGASYKGITLKTLLLLLLVVVSGVASLLLLVNYPNVFIALFFVAMILGFISVMIASASPRLAPTFSIIYALCEGMWLGTLTLIVSLAIPEFPVAFVAVLVTLGIFVAMLVLYSTKLVVASSRFRRVMFGISFSIIAVFITVGIVSIFDNGALWYAMFGNAYSPLVLFITLLLILYGSFMLVINFDNAKMIVSTGADKKYEWAVSLGLLVSIIYIYVQVIRLIIIIYARPVSY